MNNTIKIVLLVVFLLIVATAAVTVYTPTSTPTNQVTLDYDKNFEDGLKMNCSGNCPTTTSLYSREGNKAMESYVNRLTSPTSNRTEAVLGGFKMEWKRDYWFGFSIYLPTNWEIPGGGGYEILWQIHSSSNGHGGPPVKIDTVSGNWKFSTMGKTWDMGPVTPTIGKWQDIVYHYKPAKDKDGFIKIWMNGEVVGEKYGQNTYSGDAVGPYIKMGLYNGWQDRDCCEGYKPEKWVYHDALRVASGPNAGYDDVAPRDGAAPPPVDCDVTPNDPECPGEIEPPPVDCDLTPDDPACAPVEPPEPPECPDPEPCEECPECPDDGECPAYPTKFIFTGEAVAE